MSVKEGEIVGGEESLKYIRTIGATRNHYRRNQLAYQQLLLVPDPGVPFT